MTNDITSTAPDVAPATDGITDAGVSTTETTTSTEINNDTSTDITTDTTTNRDWVPEIYRDEKSLEKFKSNEDVYKSYINLEKAFAAKNGFDVESKDEYEFDTFTPEEGYEDFSVGEEAVDFIKDIAFEGKLSKEQASLLNQKITENVYNTYKETLDNRDQQEQEFKTEGARLFGDKFDEKRDLFVSIAQKNMPDNFKTVIGTLTNQQLLGVMSMVDNINSLTNGEDALASSKTGTNVSKPTSEGIAERKANLYNELRNMEQNDPGYAEKKAEYDALYYKKK